MLRGALRYIKKTAARETRQSLAFKKFHFRSFLRCAICLPILWAGSCSNSTLATTSPKCGIKLNCQAKTSCLESITVLSVILE